MNCATRTMAESRPLVAVLAAGLASRFGGSKLDARLGGKRLGQWAIDAVATAGLPPGVIVVGPCVPAFADAAQGLGWALLENAEPAAGMGQTVALAVRRAEVLERDLLVLLADMPLLEPAHLARLAAAGASAATAWPDGRLGTPALICRKDLGALRDIAGERGAGPLLARLADVQAMAAPAEMLADVDVPDDLERIARLLNARRSWP